MTDIIVPQLGESVTEATVGQWLKKAGDAVSKDEVLVELETDKVSVEVAATADGTLSEIVANEGDTVEIGAVLGRLGEEGAAASAKEEAKSDKPSEPKKDEAPEKEDKAQAASGGGESVDVTVPSMGESVTEGTIGEFLKKAGDSVSKDETIAEIETDKVALEVPATADGTISEWLVSEGDTVEPGMVIARISEGAGGGKASTPSKPDLTEDKPSAKSEDKPAASTAEDRPVSPSVRRVASEGGVDPKDIPGTGRDGRATKADALDYVNKAAESGKGAASQPEASTPQREIGPREERVKMTRLRQTIARRLKEAQDTAAMLTTFNDVDMSAVMDLRSRYKDAFLDKHGVKLGFMGFFVKACVNALKELPAVNAEIDGSDIIYKNYYDLGIAVGTDRGLVVPVVRDCDELSIAGIEKGIGDLGKKARDGSLSIGDMQGGTFTITNGGVYGSLMSTPILNPPQSGVLGMHRIEQRPVAINGEVKIRPMMYLALSYDHRIVDGKEAVTFLVRIKEALEDPERMILDL
ncbi:2-oxoglutarate dehydrogenase complex dihydrolipoyllysine-residue succinyltransferase [Henriciella sp.]|uniref:2-oxoglutarate dehydrogenase complex dihydrolipoyllysine-residue succinyltransferase n=1 Tax=Henriciella sp. TaxID=1968823 RepID=UPI0026356818|nr:2-oxoglutarate dehydrogenase complex dihydrolipoyllysine-residue succinyltransferase [Henriciella sp.]